MPRGWPKGKPRGKKMPGSGREKGVPNKRTLDLHTALIDAGCDVPHVIKTMLDENPFNAAKADFVYKIMPFLWPQRKAIEPDSYVPVEQVTTMLTTQAQKFRDILIKLGHDPEVATRAVTNGHH